MADDQKVQEARPFERNVTHSVRGEKEREEVRDQQELARAGNYQAPQDLEPQVVTGSNKSGRGEAELRVSAVGQEVLLEIGSASLKIDGDQAQRLSKQIRRVAAGSY